MVKQALTNGSTTWTDPIDTHLSRGNAALQVDVISGDVTINFQSALGIDKKFYDIEDIDGEDLTQVYINLTSDKMIIYDTMLSRSQRFKFTANADSVISVRYLQQEY